MDQGSVFKSNRSQAVRLPKSVAIPATTSRRCDVIVVGNCSDCWHSGLGEAWTDVVRRPAVQFRRTSWLSAISRSIRNGRHCRRRMRYMLDTNVAIHTIRHRPREVHREVHRPDQGRMEHFDCQPDGIGLRCAQKSAQPDRNLRDVEGVCVAADGPPLRSRSGRAHREHRCAGQSGHAHRAISIR